MPEQHTTSPNNHATPPRNFELVDRAAVVPMFAAEYNAALMAIEVKLDKSLDNAQQDLVSQEIDNGLSKLPPERLQQLDERIQLIRQQAVNDQGGGYIESKIEVLQKSHDVLEGVVDKQPVYDQAMQNFGDFALSPGSRRRTEAQTAIDFIDRNSQPLERPAAIVCIPVAVHQEPVEGVLKTLEQLYRQQGIANTEVVLWANFPNTLGAKVSAVGNYLQILQQAASRFPGLNLRPVLKGYDVKILQTASMHRIRADYMDMIALRAVKGDLSPKTPIFWLDADIIRISAGTLQAMTEAVTTSKTFAQIPTVRYTDELFKATKDFKMFNPHHVNALDELSRRAGLLPSNKWTFGTYTEEGALPGFRLEDYMLLGGVKPFIKSESNIGESGNIANTMLRNLYWVHKAVGAVEGMGSVVSMGEFMYRMGNDSTLADRDPRHRVYVNDRRALNETSRRMRGESEMIGSLKEGYKAANFHDENYRSGTDIEDLYHNSSLGLQLVHRALGHEPKPYVRKYLVKILEKAVGS